MNAVKIEAFFEKQTCTVTYLVTDKNTGHCAIVDPVLDYQPNSGRTSTESADKIIIQIKRDSLDLQWILETHAHADHLTAAPYIKKRLGGAIAIGEHIKDVQNTFKSIFNLENNFPTDGSQFGRLLKDGDCINLGESEFRIIHTPGHTPGCVSYIIDDIAIVGDTLFMPDYGTARCDFPGGDASALYHSIQKLYALPDNTRVFTGHDYQSENRDYFAWESTIQQQKANNIHIKADTSEKEFVDVRQSRDKTLDFPKLILPSIQVNIRAGEFPPKESDGTSFIKIPLNVI